AADHRPARQGGAPGVRAAAGLTAPPRAGGPRATEISACTTYDRARIGRQRGKPRPQRGQRGRRVPDRAAGPAGHPVSAGPCPQWATVAFSEPAPVMERTSISACLSSSCSGEVTEPSQPRKKPSGTEMIAGFVSGNQAKSAPGIIASSAPETTGENVIRKIALSRPP